MHRTAVATLVLLASIAAAYQARAQFPPQEGHSQEHNRAVMLWQDDGLLSTGCDQMSCGCYGVEPTCGWPEMQPSGAWSHSDPNCGGGMPSSLVLGGAAAAQSPAGFSPLQYVRSAPPANWRGRMAGPPSPPPASKARQLVESSLRDDRAASAEPRSVRPATAVVVRLEDLSSEGERNAARRASARRHPDLKPLPR